MSSLEVGLKHGFRSGLEEEISSFLQGKSINFGYETVKLNFVEPAKNRTYTPDFWIYNSDGTVAFVVETKGRFTVQDRQKMELVTSAHPELDIRFVFSRSKDRISKTSKTTYAQWCEKRGYKYADKTIPEEWLKERT